MARLMSVALTVPQVRDRSKTVTRRDGWRMLKPGDPLTLCEKVRGRKPGEPLVRITDVTVVSVRREPLNAITAEDVAAEGFPTDDRRRIRELFLPNPQGLRARHRRHPHRVALRRPAGQCARRRRPGNPRPCRTPEE